MLLETLLTLMWVKMLKYLIIFTIKKWRNRFNGKQSCYFKCEYLNSKDKAISIGESSNAKLSNSKLENNEIAIAVKDNSKVLINNVNFQNNKNQINAYKKNLQYGSGGTAEVLNSNFMGKSNNFYHKIHQF